VDDHYFSCERWVRNSNNAIETMRYLFQSTKALNPLF
jgi:hypothetical protein